MIYLIPSIHETAMPAKPKPYPQPSPTESATPSHDQIAAKAYEFWQAQGCPAGCDAEHWRQAEHALLNGSAAHGSVAPLQATGTPA